MSTRPEEEQRNTAHRIDQARSYRAVHPWYSGIERKARVAAGCRVDLTQSMLREYRALHLGLIETLGGVAAVVVVFRMPVGGLLRQTPRAGRALISYGKVAGVGPSMEIRDLARNELSRVGEIDRTDVFLEQRGTELVARRESVNSPPWDPNGHGEHSVDAQRRALVHYADQGGFARGAFSHDRLVGIGVVVPHIRPTTAQLAYLHVSHEFRSTGIGRRLCVDLELIAQRAGDAEIVTATPSENTVCFYLGRGYGPRRSRFPSSTRWSPRTST